MRITFLMPGYMWGPSGGFRVVYEYANRLVSRGHEVAVVHPRQLSFCPPVASTLRARVRRMRLGLLELVSTPSIVWPPTDQSLEIPLVRASQARHIPDGDVRFGTASHTARPPMECP